MHSKYFFESWLANGQSTRVLFTVDSHAKQLLIAAAGDEATPTRPL